MEQARLRVVGQRILQQSVRDVGEVVGGQCADGAQGARPRLLIADIDQLEVDGSDHLSHLTTTRGEKWEK